MKQIYFILFPLVFIFSCNSKKEEVNLNDYKNVITKAKNFEVLVSVNDTILHILDPETGKVEKKFVLTGKSNISKEGYKTIRVPVHGLACSSTPEIGFLESINALDNIVAIPSKVNLYSPKMKQIALSKKLLEINNISQLNFEKLISTGTRVLLFDGMGIELEGSSKLEKANIQLIPIYDWREKEALGKLEWIKLFGFLTGKSEVATTYFNETSAKYNSLKVLAKKYDNKSTVMTGNLWGGIWNSPNGDSYVAKMYEDANVNYVYSETTGTGSLSMTIEKIIEYNQNTTFWIDPGFSTKKLLLESNPKAKFVGPFIGDKVYCYSNNMNRYWEQAVVRPDKVLSDYITIFHDLNTELYFYKKVE